MSRRYEGDTISEVKDNSILKIQNTSTTVCELHVVLNTARTRRRNVSDEAWVSLGARFLRGFGLNNSTQYTLVANAECMM